MLVIDIYSTKRLVNGASGYIQNIPIDEEMEIVTFVYVKFYGGTIGGILRNPHEHSAIAIEPICQDFFVIGVE